MRPIRFITVGLLLILFTTTTAVVGSELERIEVLPGTASGIYGGGASGGVVGDVHEPNPENAVARVAHADEQLSRPIWLRGSLREAINAELAKRSAAEIVVESLLLLFLISHLYLTGKQVLEKRMGCALTDMSDSRVRDLMITIKAAGYPKEVRWKRVDALVELQLRRMEADIAVLLMSRRALEGEDADFACGN